MGGVREVGPWVLQKHKLFSSWFIYLFKVWGVHFVLKVDFVMNDDVKSSPRSQDF